MEPSLANFLSSVSRTSTFVSIDVVGSTTLKLGENDRDIMATFLAYHKQASDLAYSHHGEVIHITGDGLMCRFQRAEDAIHMGEAMLLELPHFNKKENKLNRPLRIRMGIHTGEVHEVAGVSSGQWISPTLDTTAKLQAGAPADSIHISETTYSLLKEEKRLFNRAGWDASLQIQVYALATGQKGTSIRKLPDHPRTLMVDQDLMDLARAKKAFFGQAHEVFFSYSVGQAAFIANQWQPHIILLSLDLPWDSGWNQLGVWRSQETLSSVPIVTLSRQTQGDVLQKAFKLGSNAFAGKPLEMQQLMKRVEMVLREFYL